MIFEAHSKKQFTAVKSDAPITLLGTGIQYGKTTAGAWWLRRKVHENAHHDDCFLVTSPTYKILEQSTLPPMLSVLQGLGEYRKTDACFTLNWGAKIWVRTSTDPDSVVGITNVKAIWCDEAGKYPLYFWENIEGRAAFKNAPILLTTSPYTLNWIWKDLIKPKREGKRPDFELIQAASVENPYFPRQVYEKRRETMDPRRFAMMYGGEWGRMEGMVYDCWDEAQNVCDPFQLPNGTRFVAGIDWGYNPDPFVCVVRAITPDGSHYQVSEFYKTGMTLTDMVSYCKQMQRTWGIRQFYCDRSQPGSIEEFNRNGLPASGADNDIMRGVSLHYEMIKLRRYKIFKGAGIYTVDEIETYHYPEPRDLLPDQDSRQQNPVGQSDHCLDANRYVTIETYRSGVWTPKQMSEEPKPVTNAARIAKLKTIPSRRHNHTESFD